MKTLLFTAALIAATTTIAGLPAMPAKTLEKNLVKVGDNLYANRYETTNAEYQTFLRSFGTEVPGYLRIEVNNWMEQHGEPYRDHYHTYSGYDQFPVFNISHEAVVQFCQWLTKGYNSDPQRKFNRVVFRLPTEEEWLAAARAGKQDAIFPWGSRSLRGKDGLLLCSYYFIDDARVMMDTRDRSAARIQPDPRHEIFKMPAAVFSFDPNPLGLHNMSGNAAEMLAEEGKTKGGSWGSSGYYVRLDAEDEFAGYTTSVYVGFRYFMEVLER